MRLINNARDRLNLWLVIFYNIADAFETIGITFGSVVGFLLVMALAILTCHCVYRLVYGRPLRIGTQGLTSCFSSNEHSSTPVTVVNNHDTCMHKLRLNAFVMLCLIVEGRRRSGAGSLLPHHQ